MNRQPYRLQTAVEVMAVMEGEAAAAQSADDFPTLSD